jgi:WhiB family transcriptional regulator, redox-sensing transcriptional regulator
MTANLPPPIPFDDQPWIADAACARPPAAEDRDIFFPEKGGSVHDAKMICNNCQVRGDCLTYALEHGERFGVWGGLSERERRLLRTRRPGKRRRLTADQIDEVCRLYANGLTSTALGDRYGVNPNVILRRLKERGVHIRPSTRAQPTTTGRTA